MSERPLAVVTGASSGIGAASARRLAVEGFHVVAVARREDRLHDLIKDIGGTAVRADVTVGPDVAALAGTVAGLGAPLTLLVNNAGGAFGLDPVESAEVADWQRMYDVNVLGTLRVTQALLPALVASGAGTIVVIRPSTPRPRWPARCAWSCPAARSGWWRSIPAWSGRTSSR